MLQKHLTRSHVRRNYIIFDDDKTFDVCGVTVTPLPVHHGWYFTKKEPYFCLGFLFNQSIAYISDVSFIPETTWDLLLGKTTLEGRASKEVKNTSKDPEQVAADANRTLSNGHLNGINGSDASSHTHGTSSSAAPPVLVVDCLRVYPHTSHFGCVRQGCLPPCYVLPVTGRDLIHWLFLQQHRASRCNGPAPRCTA